MILFQVILSISSMVLQNCLFNNICKKELRTNDHIYRFNMIVYAVCISLFGAALISSKTSVYTITLGLLFGVITALSNLYKMLALSAGPMHIMVDGIHYWENDKVMGMYKIWDYILNEFPGLIIDNCSSGGRRIDIETLKRSIPFFRSDYQCNFNENPEVLQTHNSGVSRYLPYNGCTSKTKNDTYAIRSSYSSSWGGAFYNAIFQSMDEEDFIWAKKITDEYRYIRKYMSMDFYNHGTECFDDTSWAIWQYHDADTQSGIVMAFRRSKSPFERVTIDLKDLLKDKTYKFTNLDDKTSKESTCSLEIVLSQKRTSTIWEYTMK